MQLFKHLTANNVKLTPLDFKRELSMESYLIENPDLLNLDDDTLSNVEIIEDELSIEDGRKSKNTHGRIDLLALYNDNTYGIIELKLDELVEDNLIQLADYLAKKEQILKKISKSDERIEKKDTKWIGILVGTSINNNLKIKISQGYAIDDTIPVAALIINRFKGGDNNIYVLTETYFKNTSRKFDDTKYKFLGEVYGKGRLVLAVIKKYIEENEKITFSELESIFPKKIQGTFGVVSTLEQAEAIITNSKEKKKSKRHFIKPEEIINLKDKTKVVVCTEWGITNIGKFIEKAKELKYKIDEVSNVSR